MAAGGARRLSKKPNFALHSYPWYVADWRESETRIEMTLEERGLYREALDYCYREGSIPEDVRKLVAIAGCTEEEFDRAWPAVSKKFTRTDDGRLENSRVNEVLSGLERWHDQRRKAGKVSGLKRRKKKGKRTEQPFDGRSTVVEREHEPSTSTLTPSSSSTPTPTPAPASAPPGHARATADHEQAAPGDGTTEQPRVFFPNPDDDEPQTDRTPWEEIKFRHYAAKGSHMDANDERWLREHMEPCNLTPDALLKLVDRNPLAGFAKGPMVGLKWLVKNAASKAKKIAATPKLAAVAAQPKDVCKLCNCTRGKGLRQVDGKVISCSACEEYARDKESAA